MTAPLIPANEGEVERLRTEAHKVARTAEMSAGIMRDTARTGGWEGAEKTARAFERLSERVYALRDGLAALRASPPPVEAGMVDALATATGLQSGPNGSGRMRVVVDGLAPGEEIRLHGLLSAMLSAAPKDMEEGR